MHRTRREVDYQGGIRSAVRGLWSGEITWGDAIDWMAGEIERNFTRAWADGMSSCGLRMDEMTLDEDARLRAEISAEIQYIYSFASAIMSNSRANNGKLRTLYDRVDMWTNRYNYIRDLAKTYACQDQKLMWVMGYTKEHCSDCRRLDGRVYRASAWRNADLYPRKHSLECEGWRCACELVPTNQPATPGFPPRI
jgi:hypothetical protein